MASTKKYGIQLDDKILYKIEQILPRLKHSVLPSKIKSWLENFEETEIDLAIDLLLVLEYITFNELQFRFDDLLKGIFKNIPKNENIIIIPYGKVGKSGSIITYIIKNTSAFRTRKKKDIDNVLLTHDYKYINAKDYNHIIFIDDFIGSGKTFCDGYKDVHDIESWVNSNKISNVYLLSALIMKDAKDYISSRFGNIKIHPEVRNKIFDQDLSPLNAFKNISTIKSMAYKYGKKIQENPNGYGNSESLVSFFFGTPNNTLPIIWSAKNDWTPLYPRKVDVKMNIARDEKKQIAFVIGLYNRLAIDLYDKDKDINIKTANGRKRDIKYNSKEHHSIIGLLKLKEDKYDDIFICHLLGLTMKELDDIYDSAIRLGLISKSKGLKIDGLNFLKEIKRTISKEVIRKETSENFKIKNEDYLPKSFKGLT